MLTAPDLDAMPPGTEITTPSGERWRKRAGGGEPALTRNLWRLGAGPGPAEWLSSTAVVVALLLAWGRWTFGAPTVYVPIRVETRLRLPVAGRVVFDGARSAPE